MIRAVNITKEFKLYQNPADRLKEIILRRTLHRSFHALKGISFKVEAGETLGIVGQNGAGKSTLLKILTGVLLPDSGTVHVDGKITGLLELGTGFNYEFTGLQNVYLNGTLLGMSREEIDARLETIEAFSELGDFIREPIKTYSSGMVMRLAFSTAIHANPKAFVVDEALSVGDAYFQQKCMRKIAEFKKNGGSIVFVSHDMNAVKILCDKGLLLDHGSVIEEGEPDKVINTYNFLLARKSKGEEIRVYDSPESGKSYGNLKVEILDAKMLNRYNEESEVFVSGEKCVVEIGLKANETMDNITVGILIRDRYGQDIFGTNTFHLKVPVSLRAGERCLVRYIMDEFNLGPGKYTLSPAAHRDETHVGECYQWVDVIRSFEVVASNDFRFVGFSKLKPRVQVGSL
ncbi:MAG: ABC transporter ATP-binding protein [Desulfobacterales bacterium]|nr:ABC transporter ATP-binding protein [Desulfobacterales bacterium]